MVQEKVVNAEQGWLVAAFESEQQVSQQ